MCGQHLVLVSWYHNLCSIPSAQQAIANAGSQDCGGLHPKCASNLSRQDFDDQEGACEGPCTGQRELGPILTAFQAQKRATEEAQEGV
jgi:hypothetical protein